MRKEFDNYGGIEEDDSPLAIIVFGLLSLSMIAGMFYVIYSIR